MSAKPGSPIRCHRLPERRRRSPRAGAVLMSLACGVIFVLDRTRQAVFRFKGLPGAACGGVRADPREHRLRIGQADTTTGAGDPHAAA